MNKLCEKFNIQLKYPKNLSFNDGWLSGFIGGGGSEQPLFPPPLSTEDGGKEE